MLENMTQSYVIDRCLAAASSCIEFGNDRSAIERMKAEFREVAREVSLWKLSGETKADLFLGPIAEELIVRHGDKVGRRLYVDFVDAFWIQTWVDIPLDPQKLARNVGTTGGRDLEFLQDCALRRRIATQVYTSSFYNN